MSALSNIELNQLRLLQIVLETRNLTRAGERAGLTQSAVSHTLKKLRASFNDALVIRQGNKLVLTPRAEALQTPLNRWLNDFERNVMVQEQFDPATSERRFIIATSDQVEQTIAPQLIKRFSKIAPHIHLVFAKLERRAWPTQIESGEVDFAICVSTSSNPALMVTTLYKDNFVSAVRKNHPFLKTKQDLDHFCQYPHILVGTGLDARGATDTALEKLGRSRDVQFKVANFSSAPYIIESSDGILTAPRKFMNVVASKHKITLFETPLKLDSFSMKIYWNVRNKDDQANRWLREQVTQLTRGAEK